MSELYRDDDLLVRRIGEGRRDRLIVTFANWSASPGLERPGFAEPFCRQYGLDAVHVTCARNHWYQVAGLERALQAIAAVARSYGATITYGVSMGAYQAVRAVAPLGAQGCVAISPQFSVDPATAPWEPRWARDRAGIRFVEGQLEPAAGADHVLVYDPWEPLDRRHAEAIRSRLPTRDLKLPFAGHDTMHFLAEAGLLSEVALGLLTGTASPQSVRGRVRQGRRKSPTYLAGVARCERLAPDRRARALEASLALAPRQPRLWLQLGALRLEQNDLDAARAAAAGAAEAGGDELPVCLLMGKVAMRAQDWETAALRLRRVLDLDPRRAAARQQLHRVLVRLGRDDEAAAVAGQPSV